MNAGLGALAPRSRDLASHEAIPEHAALLSWICRAPNAPYFVTDTGETWTPIGHNDAVCWPELAPLFHRRDLPAVEAHLRWLKSQGVTCLRIMLEYCQGNHRYFERPAGVFVPSMVQLWDDLFMLLERVGLHVLLTPFDTFFMWIRWSRHPYNKTRGGPCADRREWLICPELRAAMKARLQFVSDRWGGSPALFAWDIFNEMHPANALDDAAHFTPFIDDVSTWLRDYERRRHGRAHLQTASIFGPELLNHPLAVDPIFRHPALDFANTHLYETGTIDDPPDTVIPALAVGRLIREALLHTSDGRPVFDSEHGPIHRFRDKRQSLPIAFDEEYFRHMQWAHLASGGAGGGMRWPNRHPHVLTPGMRDAQRALSDFLPLLNWSQFRRRNLNQEVTVATPGIAQFACGDADQALVWLLRTDTIGPDGTLTDTPPSVVRLTVPGLRPGLYRVTRFDTKTGRITGAETGAAGQGGTLPVEVAVADDVALAIQRE
jgi:hypothetical protein